MLCDQVHTDIVYNEISFLRAMDHKNIIKFIDQYDDLCNIYIVMELCRFGTLKSMQIERKKITEHECRYFLHQIFHGLSYLHNKNIIHRDLKMANVFLFDNLSVKIGDFGLATYVKENGELEKSSAGTINYFAPERLTELGYSIEVDVWSVGVIMHALLLGKLPFAAKKPETIRQKIANGQYR